MSMHGSAELNLESSKLNLPSPTGTHTKRNGKQKDESHQVSLTRAIHSTDGVSREISKEDRDIVIEFLKKQENITSEAHGEVGRLIHLLATEIRHKYLLDGDRDEATRPERTLSPHLPNRHSYSSDGHAESHLRYRDSLHATSHHHSPHHDHQGSSRSHRQAELVDSERPPTQPKGILQHHALPPEFRSKMGFESYGPSLTSARFSQTSPIGESTVPRLPYPAETIQEDFMYYADTFPRVPGQTSPPTERLSRSMDFDRHPLHHSAHQDSDDFSHPRLQNVPVRLPGDRSVMIESFEGFLTELRRKERELMQKKHEQEIEAMKEYNEQQLHDLQHQHRMMSSLHRNNQWYGLKTKQFSKELQEYNKAMRKHDGYL
ncbi:hypothetical protein PROFUN_14334 [Planoprotostelium fungivorum]|uniref:Uncharacterized protein n=1 Tax=Planoprotostelium fungivorum TaxID=1890364 RepID=A0A2P6N0F7_9EUKA|nr:hypothetical protein PROFUN_14334 [Planoprotostelium fungivorum]